MPDFSRDATKSTPRIFFDAENHVLEISGESYPENTAEFYGPLFTWLDKRLDGVGDGRFTVNVELLYFNSSSSKILMNLFDRLEAAAENGRSVVVNWIYNRENENSPEYGAEFKEDLTTLEFNLVEKAE